MKAYMEFVLRVSCIEAGERYLELCKETGFFLESCHPFRAIQQIRMFGRVHWNIATTKHAYL